MADHFLMEAAPYLPSSYENNQPLSKLCLWKKKKNAVFPTSHSLFTMETWAKDAMPSTSQTSGISYRSDSEPCLSPVMLNSDLPGSVTNLFDELKTHPSCIIKSITIDNDSIEDTHNFINSCVNESSELAECQTNDRQAYIPYNLAKMYISKIAVDMQNMKLKYMGIIKEIHLNTKKQQEQVSLSLRNHYRDKMKILKTRIQAYHDVMEKKSQNFQDKIKDLEMEKEQWIEEKTSLLLELNQLKEKLEYEKCRVPNMEKMESELVKCPLCNGDYHRQISDARSEEADEVEQISYIH